MEIGEGDLLDEIAALLDSDADICIFAVRGDETIVLSTVEDINAFLEPFRDELPGSDTVH